MAIEIHTEDTPAMTWQEIAEQLTLEEGVPYNEEQVRSIYRRAMVKIRKHVTIVKSHGQIIF